MTWAGTGAWGVVQLLADVFADALKLAAAGALGAIGLVADNGERFGVRASLAHGNPGDKGYRVRIKIRGHHRP
jgi:hypothetical protein